jgi:hypothetical protein
MHASAARPGVVSALAGLALEVNEVLHASVGAAWDDESVPAYALDPAAAVELEASLFSGGWVRGVRGRLVHVNSSDLLAAPPGD